MFKKTLPLVLIIFLISCASTPTYNSNGKLNNYSVIKSVDEHTVAVAAICEMSEEEYNRRLREGKKNILHINRSVKMYPLQLAIPLEKTGNPNKFIAYLGAGKIISDGNKFSQHIILCSHVVSHDDGAYSMSIWVFKDNLDQAIPATIVAKTDMEPWTDDYAVIKTKEHFGLPGLKLAKSDEVKKFDKVIFSGSVGGLAFFSRMVNVTTFRNFFKRGADGKLHLSYWTDYNFWIVYPGGGGDSGGSVCTLDGKIFSIMAWGVIVYEEAYIMGNPTSKLLDFLHYHDLEYLGK